MVYLPRGETTPLADPPVVQPFPGLDTLRRQTHWYITNDPTSIDLVPVARVQAPGGGWNSEPQPPRPTQIFKLIYQGGLSDGAMPTQDGVQRRYDFVILGEWDATIAIGDSFTDPDGQKWVVTGMQPYNGYEVKAGVTSYGGSPTHG